MTKSVDLKTMQETALAERIASLMSHDAALRYNADAVDGRSGILRVGTRFFMFAAHPVLTNIKTGPSNGTLLVARELDHDMFLTNSPNWSSSSTGWSVICLHCME